MKCINVLVTWLFLPFGFIVSFPAGVLLAYSDVRWWINPGWYQYSDQYSAPTKFPIAWILLIIATTSLFSLVMKLKKGRSKISPDGKSVRVLFVFIRLALLLFAGFAGVIGTVVLMYVGTNSPT